MSIESDIKKIREAMETLVTLAQKSGGNGSQQASGAIQETVQQVVANPIPQVQVQDQPVQAAPPAFASVPVAQPVVAPQPAAAAALATTVQAVPSAVATATAPASVTREQLQQKTLAKLQPLPNGLEIMQNLLGQFGVEMAEGDSKLRLSNLPEAHFTQWLQTLDSI